jgi:hypothetical protein
MLLLCSALKIMSKHSVNVARTIIPYHCTVRNLLHALGRTLMNCRMDSQYETLARELHLEPYL